MDTAQWSQEIVVKPMEEIVPITCSNLNPSLERRVRPQKEQALNCPRCNSTNTKFCYYNNYSLSQPRYFCKTCRRYWTEGGSLRNIPVGGGSRKNKRSSSSSSSFSSFSPSSKKTPDLVSPPSSSQNPSKIQDGQDLNLGFPNQHDFKTISELITVPNFESSSSTKNLMPSSSCSSTTTSDQLSALELLSTGINTSRVALNTFMAMPIPDPNTGFSSSGFSLPEFKPSLSFSLEGLGSGGNGDYGSTLQGVQEITAGGRLLFPFEDLKQVSSGTATDVVGQQNREHGDHSTGGYWNGMLGGGSW